jgi:thiosulfate/3-mercaptopyruvate sulfurtransferase
MLGHNDVAMLDGGFDAWRAAGRPVVTATAGPKVGHFTPRARPELRALREDIERGVQLLDVRSAVEFQGATPFGEARGGHVPGARHLDWRTLLDEGGRVRPASRMLRALADAGIDAGREIVTCCSTGQRSAFVATVLSARGLPNVRVYDGGLLEWSSSSAAPLAR